MLYKYPRTYHVPWSKGFTSDDKVLKDLSHFDRMPIVITEKRDGENTTLYTDHYHARSIDSIDHESRHWLKQFWSTFRHDIPTTLRICGENLYAKHSIGYEDLDTYFEVFSIWEGEVCLSWEDTKLWCNLLGLKHVPVLWEGVYEYDMSIPLPNSFSDDIFFDRIEGYVIRLADEFLYDDFKISVAKWVRKGHVQTNQHWMHSEIIPNKLRGDI